jgi:hypothetical protein
MTDTSETIATRIAEFVRSEAAKARQLASAAEAETSDANETAAPLVMLSVEDLMTSYRSCIQKFSGRERAALDLIIRAL